MIGADAASWLELWERGVPLPPRPRRLALLASSGLPGEVSAEQLELGRANAQLLRLHCSMFGARLSCRAECPKCKTALELELDSEELAAREPAQPVRPMKVRVGEWEVVFRLPTEGDVDVALGESDPLAARDVLLRRCVTECRRGADAMNVSLAPPEVTARIGERMEESDPLATIDFALRCAGCRHSWSSSLEVDVFLWTRLNAWVHRLLQDVHTLAKVYGWSERAITGMSPWRRQLYLDLVEG